MPHLDRAEFPRPKQRPPAILIVEDEVLVRLILSDYLQECGFRVYEAGNAADAIAILEADKTAIDLVFTDVRMPGAIDGFGLARWIRANRPGLPVVLTSGDQRKTEVVQELCANDPFFAKPYDAVVVVAQMRAIIDEMARRHLCG